MEKHALSIDSAMLRNMLRALDVQSDYISIEVFQLWGVTCFTLSNINEVVCMAMDVLYLNFPLMLPRSQVLMQSSRKQPLKNL